LPAFPSPAKIPVKLIPLIPLVVAALALAGTAAAQTSGEMSRSAGGTAQEWTSPRSFASDALVCTDVWIRGVKTSASAASSVGLTYQRAGIVVQLVFRRYRAPMRVRYVSFTRPGTVRVRWTIVQRAADCA
jgi:hypothetical protein